MGDRLRLFQAAAGQPRRHRNRQNVQSRARDHVILIHGFTDTSRMWRPILPALAKEYTVITPDLPGLGGSSFLPSGEYDMKTVAQHLHELVKRLGYTRIRLVGHDIGMMAA